MLVKFNEVFKKDENGKLVEGVGFTATVKWDADLVRRLMSISSPTQDLVFETVEEYYIPKRRHKKKRIQKKWTKRYGVIAVGGIVRHRINGVRAIKKTDGDICEFEFVKGE